MRKSLKTIKNTFFTASFVILATTLLTNCENEGLTSFNESNEINTGVNIKTLNLSSDGLNTSYTTNLMAGQHHIAGTVTVTSDQTYLYVTYKTNCTDGDNDTEEDTSFKTSNDNRSWTLKATHLYVGNCGDIPITKKGNPKIGKFPYKTEHPNGINEFIYTIPLLDIGECFCLAAHAEVDCGECDNNDDDSDDDNSGPKFNGNTDDYCGEETAWAAGEGFPGNSWAMYIEFCLQNEDGGNGPS
ncbi:hypothetical protein [Aquimarina sp. 2201CG14-23]|uniref:hypothetical protein n=1 Tax=Aquimarina mycalae TaxID=3040073 RepID=UPI002477DCBB|nr:hypothetical protein [Aquimarina sp. 2201CG14-23]MDH7444401.1 hypothetical protein [Aquimarina sp. 2201CG14-23]